MFSIFYVVTKIRLAKISQTITPIASHVWYQINRLCLQNASFFLSNFFENGLQIWKFGFFWV